MLTRTHGCFHWSEIDNRKGLKLPSPRYKHRGWEYNGHLWIFGGYGSPLDIYLNEYGNFAVNTIYDDQGTNNQLLCYDPSTQQWTNPECSGSVPFPQFNHASSIIQNKVWLFGGDDEDCMNLDDLFQFAMSSYMDIYFIWTQIICLIWTQIESGQVKPNCMKYSLTAISETELISVNVFWVGSSNSDVWIMDLTSQTWKQYTSPRDHRRFHNAAVSGVNWSVIVTGGDGSTGGTYTHTYHVMLEPKSLQQLAMKTVFKQRSVLPWKCLPTKLIAKLGLLEA